MTATETNPETKRRLPPPGRLLRLWDRVRPYRGMLALATVALVLSGLIGLAFPMVVRYLLDAAFVRHDRSLLDRIALGLVVLFCIQAALNYAQTYFLSAVGEQAVAGIRRDRETKHLYRCRRPGAADRIAGVRHKGAHPPPFGPCNHCLLYTSDAADD